MQPWVERDFPAPGLTPTQKLLASLLSSLSEEGEVLVIYSDDGGEPWSPGEWPGRPSPGLPGEERQTRFTTLSPALNQNPVF